MDRWIAGDNSYSALLAPWFPDASRWTITTSERCGLRFKIVPVEYLMFRLPHLPEDASLEVRAVPGLRIPDRAVARATTTSGFDVDGPLVDWEKATVRCPSLDLVDTVLALLKMTEHRRITVPADDNAAPFWSGGGPYHVDAVRPRVAAWEGTRVFFAHACAIATDRADPRNVYGPSDSGDVPVHVVAEWVKVVFFLFLKMAAPADGGVPSRLSTIEHHVRDVAEDHACHRE